MARPAADRSPFLNAVKAMFGDIETITREQVLEVIEKKKLPYPAWLTNDPSRRAGRGVYTLTENQPREKRSNTLSSENNSMTDAATVEMAGAIVPFRQPNVVDDVEQFIPQKATGYVPFGHFEDVQKIIKSMIFYPTYITGLSGNGKTLMVEQACAAEGRECIRVNITIETDEDDLIGGFRLVDGETKWHDGPVVTAMKRGAVLLLDEIDLGSNKIMCLQPILEGKGIFLKKVKTFVAPTKGFTIIATANTKGKGSDDGRFIGTNVMNEAFLERFSITMEQEYPGEETEVEILNNLLESHNQKNPKFTSRLVKWAMIVRKTFMDGAVDEIISTRRLVHIINAFLIWGNEDKAINLCLSRFDETTKSSFLELYMKLVDTESAKPKKEKKQDLPDYTKAQPF